MAFVAILLQQQIVLEFMVAILAIAAVLVADIAVALQILKVLSAYLLEILAVVARPQNRMRHRCFVAFRAKSVIVAYAACGESFRTLLAVCLFPCGRLVRLGLHFLRGVAGSAKTFAVVTHNAIFQVCLCFLFVL